MGTIRKRNWSSGSIATNAGRIGALPWLSTASSWRPWRLPDDSVGRSSRRRSSNAATSSTPSSTTEPVGSSLDTTRIANGVGPCRVVGARGASIDTTTVSSAAGKSEISAGATVIHSGSEADRFEGELVDDAARVAHAELGLRVLAGDHVQSRLFERC